MIKEQAICQSIMKGLPPQQAKIMQLFGDHDSLTLKEVIRYSFIKRTSGPNQVTALLKKGLLKKDKHFYSVRNNNMILFLQNNNKVIR